MKLLGDYLKPFTSFYWD